MSIPSSAPRRKRSLTRAEFDTWRLFVETSERITGVVMRRLLEETGLSGGDYAVLVALTEHPERRMRSSHLADHVGWERSRLSHHLGRMERRGLVRRERVEGDSRGAEVVLTEHGERLFRAATAPHLRAVKEEFARGLTPEQLAALNDAMAALASHAQRARED